MQSPRQLSLLTLSVHAYVLCRELCLLAEVSDSSDRLSCSLLLPLEAARSETAPCPHSRQAGMDDVLRAVEQACVEFQACISRGRLQWLPACCV